MEHPSQAHVVLQMSLAQWVHFELKSYAQIEHQCIVSSLWEWEGQSQQTKEDKRLKY
jgi:hypothetical protein